MKYLLILLLGITIGIGGEFLIPKNLWTTVGSGCIKQTADGRVYMPELRIYDSKWGSDTYPIIFGGRPMTFVPSYRYALALLTGEISYLNTDECNKLVEKIQEHEK